MKFEKLTDNKIRIIFTLADMTEKKISAPSFFTDKTISQQLLQTMISEAEKEVDFKTDDCKLLVEAFSNIDGDIIVTITKLSDCIDKNFSNEFSIYKFENFDNLLDCYKYLKNMNLTYSDNFSFVLYNNSFYLYFLNDNFSHSNYLTNILTEFADSVEFSPKIIGTLNEYGKKIFNNIKIQ